MIQEPFDKDLFNDVSNLLAGLIIGAIAAGVYRIIFNLFTNS